MPKCAAVLLSALLLLTGCRSVVRAPARPVRPRPVRPAVLEFYYLKDARTQNNPMGKWQAETPSPGRANNYIFRGPAGETISSVAQPRELMEKVVGAKHNSPVLTAADILPTAKASIVAGDHIVVNIEFDRHGRKVFREFTRAHVGDMLAVFSDGKLLTAPVINEAIPSGRAEIAGFTTLARAKECADALNGVGCGP